MDWVVYSAAVWVFCCWRHLYAVKRVRSTKKTVESDRAAAMPAW